MDNFSNNLSYVYSPALLYLGIAVSLAILVLPSITLGLVWLWRDWQHRRAAAGTSLPRAESPRQDRAAA